MARELLEWARCTVHTITGHHGPRALLKYKNANRTFTYRCEDTEVISGQIPQNYNI